MANKSLLEMVVTCAPVKDQAKSRAPQTHVAQISAVIKVEPYRLANKYLLEMAATCAHAKIQELYFAHPTHVDQVVVQVVD